MTEDPVPTPLELAQIAADRAAQRAIESGLKARELAKADEDRVKRAISDARIDRDLEEHATHLAKINGSQTRMADSLKHVEDTLVRLLQAAEFQRDEAKGKVSSRTLWLAAAGVVSGYAAILAAILLR